MLIGMAIPGAIGNPNSSNVILFTDFDDHIKHRNEFLGRSFIIYTEDQPVPIPHDCTWISPVAGEKDPIEQIHSILLGHLT